MRILVCGGRDYDDREHVYRILNRVHVERCIDMLIQGSAAGADFLASEWAFHSGVPVASYPADWKKHGRRAGPIRNQQMLDEGKPDAVIAFPGGKGTADMVRRAKAAGVPVWEIAAGNDAAPSQRASTAPTSPPARRCRRSPPR